MFCEKVYILKSTQRSAKGLRGFAEEMFLGGGGARPGGRLLTSSTFLPLLLLNLIGCQSEMELQEKLKARKQNPFY